MNEKERFYRTMAYQSADRRPLHLVGPWEDTLERWYHEGLPRGTDPHAGLGLKSLHTINVSGNSGIWPLFEQRVIREEGNERLSIDSYGRTVRDFTDHTSMPEWIDFPVKDRDSLKRVLDEHYSIDRLDERFGDTWEKALQRAAADPEALIMVDGGCYYWTLRSLAGVEVASYLFYDAPDLVDELIGRYHTVAMEGIRRATARMKVDVVGFGEDIAYKTGTLISPAMFREFILPRYRSIMDLAHRQGITLSWYDSDGDCREFVPDYLSVGIDTLAPCEVAANMAPVELRRRFGRDLRMIGGVDKREVAKGRKAIDAELARLKPLIDEGGFVPAIDHSVSADISYADYRYFLDRLQIMLAQ